MVPTIHSTPRRKFAFVAACLLAAAVVANAKAATLSGVVVALSDGDTVTVLDDARQQHKVRLAGIDAPEKHQPFGDRAKQALALLAFRKQVTVEWHKQDRYSRLVGVLRVDSVDVGLELVRAGLAWHYVAYEREQSASDRKAYSEGESHARASHLGVWSDPDPTPPWEFRRRVHSSRQDQ